MLQDIKLLDLSLHAQPGSLRAETIASGAIAANHISTGALTLDKFDHNFQERILQNTQLYADNTVAHVTISPGSSVIAVSLITEGISLFRGLMLNGTTDGEIWVDIGNATRKYQDFIFIMKQSTVFSLPSPEIVQSGTEIRAWVRNNGGVEGEFGATLLLDS